MENSIENIFLDDFFDTSNRSCQIIVDILAGHGVKHIVCSPGSRNTPLLLAVAARDCFVPHVVVDERTAAFVALGVAQVTQKPVALVCTSGTAMLNYAPAVAESYYQGLPLIVISADRPSQWIDQDDSQTIRQPGALDHFIKRGYDITAAPDPDKEMAWLTDRLVNDAMIEALSPRKGPVHINVRLSEPLGGMECLQVKEEPRIIKMIGDETAIGKATLDRLAGKALERRVMIIAGFMRPSARLNKAMLSLVKMPGVVVMAESLSNLHLPPESGCVDTVLARQTEIDGESFLPDIVISVGGAIVSRKIKEYVRSLDNLEHWAVGHQHTTVDCFMSLSLRIEADPDYFFTQLQGRMKKIIARKGMDSSCSERLKSYKDNWHMLQINALGRVVTLPETLPWSDLKAYGILFKKIPDTVNLFLSNGTSVRYAQIYSYKLPHASYCNRGVSGIEGATSTAIGGAMVYKGGLTVLVTGDMSFSYDIGALQLKETPDSMRIVIVSNAGGGIFRFIPSTSSISPKEVREQFFCSDPCIDIESIAKAFGWKYLRADSAGQLSEVLDDFFNANERKSILEIKTPPEESALILRNFLSPNHH